jgi:hypothetical protein
MVRFDRKATAISLIVVIGVRADGQKVLLALKSMGDEGTEAWRARIPHRRWPAARTRRLSHRTCGAAIRAFDVESIAGGAR